MRIFFLLILLSFSYYASAQDKNMLARIAFEDAEKAYSEGKLEAAIKELQKVDELLATITPKSQYLRILVWSSAVELDKSNAEQALIECKKYFQMSERSSLPEDKLMEVTRMVVKFEKDIIANKEELAAHLNSVKKIVDFRDALFRELKFKAGLTETEFLAFNPAIADLKRVVNGLGIPSYKGSPKVNGPWYLHFDGGIAKSYGYIIVGDKTTANSIRGIYERFMLEGKASHPKSVIEEYKDQIIFSYQLPEEKMTYRFDFLYYESYGNYKYPVIAVHIISSEVK